MSELQLGQTKIKCVWVLRGDLDSQLSSLESKILTTPETLSSTLTLRSKNQGLNFEKENLIKKSKEEVNGVEREASNRNSIEIQKHLFSLILNFKVCNILERRKRKLPSTRKPRKRIPPKKLQKILFSNPPRGRSDTGMARACWTARLARASFFSLARSCPWSLAPPVWCGTPVWLSFLQRWTLGFFFWSYLHITYKNTQQY